MFKSIVKSIYNFGDKVDDKINSVMNFFVTKIYNFIHRKELAKKAAIKAKVKELADKFGLHIKNEYALYSNNHCELAFLYVQCDTLKSGDLDYYITCATDFAVARNSWTNFKYGVVTENVIKFYDINDNIDKHIQKLIGRYKECLNEARKKQIEFDFTENKEPLFNELCKYYNLQKMESIADDNIYYHSYIIPYFDLYYSQEKNKILFNNLFVEQESNIKDFNRVELNYNTFEEYREFIDLRIKNYKKLLNIQLNKMLNKKGKTKNDN